MQEKKTWGSSWNRFLMKDGAFVFLVCGAAAAVFAGTFLYVKYGTGAFNEIFVAAMLKAENRAGYVAAAGFALGFLAARLLEGPMVGLLDIGGCLQTGVGVGIPALFLALGWELPFTNFYVALSVGALIGLAVAGIFWWLGKKAPEGVALGGMSVLMGAGNALGRYLAPLVIIAAASYHVSTGVGALLGAALFYKWDKEMTIGALFGAMIVGGIFL